MAGFDENKGSGFATTYYAKGKKPKKAKKKSWIKKLFNKK